MRTGQLSRATLRTGIAEGGALNDDHFGAPETTEKSYYDARQRAVEAELATLWLTDFGETIAKFVDRARGSQYDRLLSQMATSAEVYSKSQNKSLETFQDETLEDAMNVCRQVHFACRAHALDDEGKNIFDVRHHKEWPWFMLGDVEAPPIDREEIQMAVGLYLKLPFRCEMMDRVLVDALMAHEVQGYAHAMFNKKSYSLSPFKERHVLVSWFMDKHIVMLGSVAALLLYLGSIGKIGQSWLNAVIVGILVFGLISAVWLPFAWRAVTREKKGISDLMREMINTYRELDTSGPVSATRVHDLVTKSGEKGVVWPSSLFTLLEDIKSRSGWF
jgi:hypothetical protein